jgi:hypothetical protein
MGEEWRAIEGFPRYRVSNLGGAQRQNHRGEWVACSQAPNTSGYPRVFATNADGRRRTAATHILVAEAFLGPRPSPDAEVRHLDGSRTNNRVENLAYGTRADNAQDSIRHGTHQKFRILGEQNGLAKLTAEGVRQIVARVNNGESKTSLARQFKCVPDNITAIMQGRSWSHITGFPKKPRRYIPRRNMAGQQGVSP